MTTSTTKPVCESASKSGTRISFDLASELTSSELEQFAESARAAGAETLTEHFLNITIRLQAANERGEA